MSQGGIQWVPFDSGLRPRPHCSFPWQGFRPCATLAEEVTLDYATGENFGQGKFDAVKNGDSNPFARRLRDGDFSDEVSASCATGTFTWGN